MNREDFDSFCASLDGVSHVEQWGGASVWKLGGKIFAICSRWGEGDHGKISFKCSDIAYEILPNLPGIIPAPYLARAKWVQIENEEAMTDEDIRDHILTAYHIIMRKLTKARRAELGLVLIAE